MISVKNDLGPGVSRSSNLKFNLISSFPAIFLKYFFRVESTALTVDSGCHTGLTSAGQRAGSFPSSCCTPTCCKHEGETLQQLSPLKYAERNYFLPPFSKLNINQRMAQCLPVKSSIFEGFMSTMLKLWLLISKFHRLILRSSADINVSPSLNFK